MKKVLVIGASGLVGSKFCELAKGDLDITPADEKIIDITSESSVNNFFEKNKFDAIVNFAAFTNVDAAQKENGDENGLTFRLNVLGPRYLVNASEKNNMFLLHISTDFVFPGSESYPGPYSEDSKLPENQEGIGWYGWTKKLAEEEVLKEGSKHAVVRYGYPFRADSFELKVDWARNLIKLYNEQKLYPLFEDMNQNILLIDDLIAPMVKIINEELTGVFHIASNDVVTPYEISKYLLEKYSGKEVDLQKGSMQEFLKAEGRTPRPRLGGLKTEKTQEKLGIKFKTAKEMVDEFLQQIK